MGDPTESGRHDFDSSRRGAEGRRWTDNAKVIWALIGAIALIVMSWGGVVYTTAHSSEMKNIEQDVRIQSLESKFERIDIKQDKILERLPK